MADGGARKRKWDAPAPGVGSAVPSGAPSAPPQPAAAALQQGSAAQAALLAAQARAQAIAAAAAFAARLSSTPGAAPAGAAAAAAPAEQVAQAFDLNELAPLVRGALTKRPVHEEVTRKTGCILHTRRVAPHLPRRDPSFRRARRRRLRAPV